VVLKQILLVSIVPTIYGLGVASFYIGFQEIRQVREFWQCLGIVFFSNLAILLLYHILFVGFGSTRDFSQQRLGFMSLSYVVILGSIVELEIGFLVRQAIAIFGVILVLVIDTLLFRHAVGKRPA
jgi:hypothetical protein